MSDKQEKKVRFSAGHLIRTAAKQETKPQIRQPKLKTHAESQKPRKK